MSYVKDMPNASDIPSVSQAQLKINFQQLFSWSGRDHESLIAAAGFFGKHRFCTLTPQGAGNATLANEVSLYSKSLGGAQTLYFRRPSSGTEIPLTGPIDPIVGANGCTFLPGGLMLQWGQTGAIAAGTNAVVNFSSAFSGNAYSVTITGRHNGSEIVGGNIAAIGAANFTLRNTSVAARDFYWIAMGPR